MECILGILIKVKRCFYEERETVKLVRIQDNIIWKIWGKGCVGILGQKNIEDSGNILYH